MRRALGLKGALPSYPAQQRTEQARTRRRFVQDGEVPVEMVTGSRVSDIAPDGRVVTLQAALDGERTARAGTERALVEAQATLRSLQAKLAHADLAHGEALAVEQRAREQAETALRDAVSAHEQAEERSDAAAVARATLDAPAPRMRSKRAGLAKLAPRTPAAKVCEPQPVKWWLPSYRTKAKAR